MEKFPRKVWISRSLSLRGAPLDGVVEKASKRSWSVARGYKGFWIVRKHRIFMVGMNGKK
jgi:hypothetical protein